MYAHKSLLSSIHIDTRPGPVVRVFRCSINAAISEQIEQGSIYIVSNGYYRVFLFFLPVSVLPFVNVVGTVRGSQKNDAGA
jgi:hypothetical protein